MFSAYAEFATAVPWSFPLAAFVFGAIVGSFLNVVIYRVPLDRSIVTPGSHCGCGAPVAWYDNIPILSWFILRGRARCCGQPYSFRYPFVELLTGVLFLACWNLFPPVHALCGMLFLGALVCATFIDLDHMIIPDLFTIGLAVVGVVLSLAVPSLHGRSDEFFLVASLRAGLVSVEGVLIGSALVLWIALLAETLLRKEAMGFGDVKFVGAIGAFCGWQGAVFAIFGGAIIGTLWFACAKLIQLVLRRSPAPAPAWLEPEAAPRAGFGDTAGLAFGTHVPFGPMLAIAGAIYFLYAHRWVDVYFADLAVLF